MEEKLLEYSEELVEALKAGITFTGEQAPLLIQEVLHYYMISAVLESVIFTVVCGLFLYFIYYIMKNSENKDSIFERNTYDNLHRIVPISLSTVFCVISFFSVVFNIFQIIKISVAPRLFLIEKLTSLF